MFHTIRERSTWNILGAVERKCYNGERLYLAIPNGLRAGIRPTLSVWATQSVATSAYPPTLSIRLPANKLLFATVTALTLKNIAVYLPYNRRTAGNLYLNTFRFTHNKLTAIVL